MKGASIWNGIRVSREIGCAMAMQMPAPMMFASASDQMIA